jgi:hypothetical protein
MLPKSSNEIFRLEFGPEKFVTAKRLLDVEFYFLLSHVRAAQHTFGHFDDFRRAFSWQAGRGCGEKKQATRRRAKYSSLDSEADPSVSGARM